MAIKEWGQWYGENKKIWSTSSDLVSGFYYIPSDKLGKWVVSVANYLHISGLLLNLQGFQAGRMEDMGQMEWREWNHGTSWDIMWLNHRSKLLKIKKILQTDRTGQDRTGLDRQRLTFWFFSAEPKPAVLLNERGDILPGRWQWLMNRIYGEHMDPWWICDGCSIQKNYCCGHKKLDVRVRDPSYTWLFNYLCLLYAQVLLDTYLCQNICMCLIYSFVYIHIFMYNWIREHEPNL